ncbi:MAG TPA: hypothetical protein VL282_19485 [Tepidisphaeraceae bacterium]|jgi:hypothetical protein|nr:hypothetical protein [Tepidisphaeraceae bacterium]
MPRKLVVSYRDPTTPDVAENAFPEYMVSVVVFAMGVILFAMIAISHNW